MPRRNDLEEFLIIGSGPIVIGQACEFDYSGTQGAKALRAGGLRGRPRQLEPGHDHDRSGARATGRTSSRSSRATLDAHHRARAPDALLPTLGGQTALNLALALDDDGVARRSYGVELLGAPPASIAQGRGPLALQGRRWRRSASTCPRAGVRALASRRRGQIVKDDGLPRHPAPVLHDGRLRRRHRHDRDEFDAKVAWALAQSPDAARCSSRRACSAGRSSSSRSSATARTTSSSSARSRTSTRWACTPATRSPSRRR